MYFPTGKEEAALETTSVSMTTEMLSFILAHLCVVNLCHSERHKAWTHIFPLKDLVTHDDNDNVISRDDEGHFLRLLFIRSFIASKASASWSQSQNSVVLMSGNIMYYHDMSLTIWEVRLNRFKIVCILSLYELSVWIKLQCAGNLKIYGVVLSVLRTIHIINID